MHARTTEIVTWSGPS